MGNHKFRLSDMIPNAWFYKLRDMSITKLRNHNQTNTTSHPTIKNKKLSSPSKKPSKPSIVRHESIIRKDNKLICTSSKNPTKSAETARLLRCDSSPARKSTKLKRAKRKTIYMPSPRKVVPSLSSGYVFHEPGNPVWLKPGNVRFQEKISMFPSNRNNNNGDPFSSSSPDHGFFESLSSASQNSDSFDTHCKNEMIASFSSSCSCKLSSSATDIIIDVEESNAKIDSTVEDFELVSEPKLPPILTKPIVKHETSLEKSTKPATKLQARSSTTTARKSISHGGRVKIRGNTSARFSGKRSDFRARKSDLKKSDQNQKGLFYSDSFAIVKASVDPEKDFRDSMVEMIVENNIRASKDLEDLLACYLSLNANQYHDVIIRAFQQIWFNMCELLS